MNDKVGSDNLSAMKPVVIRAVVTSLFVVAVPVLLISASVAWAVNDLGLYARGFDKYDIPTVTGIEREDLVQVGREIRSYFHSTQEPLDVRTTIYGREQVLFNYREVIHMADVKDLIWVVYGAGALALFFMTGVGAAGFVRRGRSFTPALCRRILWGAEATVGFVALVGLISLVAFEQLFLLFHQVSFANDFWQLDPRRDFLVMIFPEGFWLDATFFVAFLTLVGAALLAAISGGYMVLRRPPMRRKLAGLLDRLRTQRSSHPS